MKSLSALDWSEILLKVQNFATSGSAKAQISETGALANALEAKDSFQEILDASEILNSGTRPFMESLDLFDPWFSRIKKKAVLKNLEIKDVRHFCLEVLALHEVLEQTSTPLARTLAQELMSAEEPLSAIDQIMTPRGDIRSDASETLYRLFREKENLARQIESTLDRLVGAHEMTSFLQDKYVTTREGRWVLPIRGGMQHYVPGVIHGSSQTKQTVYMEPEIIIPMNNRLRQVEVEIEDEIERLLTQLSEYLSGLTNDFERSRRWMLKTDIILAKAQFCSRIQGVGCDFSENEILLNEIKHPLLVLSGKPVVGNTVRMDSEKRILLLSGPNAGGKTVLLKSIGLAAQLARCGFLIPAAEGSVLPFFKQIHIGIGDSQSVDEELSTFAAHLKLLDEATQLKGSHCLILVDEICGSTDPEEGSALARSFIENFAANQVFAVVTSHLGPLKSGWKQEDPVLNGSLEYDLERGLPTYQFLQGIPGDSLAIQTAKRVGVPAAIVERAIELLSPLAKAKLEKLEELDQIKADLQLLRDHLKADAQKAKNEKDKYNAMILNFEREKENMLKKTQREAEKKIEDLISHAKVEQTFKKHSTLQEIKNTLPEIIKSKPGTGASSGISPISNADDFAKRYPPGSKIFVPSLGQDGLIQSTPNSKGEVLILSGSLRLSVSWQDLKSAEKLQNPTADLVRRSSHVTVALSDTEKTLDVRGKTVTEALEELEAELDLSAARSEDRIKIIHGHGTEALKKAVRTFLSRSVFVKKWKAGTPEQGGDGVTWAELTRD